MIGTTHVNSNLGDVYYIKGASQSDGVGAYTFIAPIDGSLYIIGDYSTLGFYVNINGTQAFKVTGSQDKQSYTGKTVSGIKKGDEVTVYCQGIYLGVMLETIETFDTNL